MPPAASVSRIRRCDACSQLIGACMARQPPAGSSDHRRGISARWSGSHWITALENNSDGVAAGCQSARSPCSQCTRDGVARALASICGELSMPTTVAAGQRSASMRVMWPLPQPRSYMRRGSASGTRAIRSRAGRRR